MPKLLLPKVIGHRGAKAYAPENTLASIHTAADLGVGWVEVDVKLTKDGTAIIFHDEDLDRTTGTHGLVRDMTWQEISELDAGSWFGESFLNERVPTLEQLLDVVIERGLGVNLEIKPCPGREVDTAEATLDIASRVWPDDKPPPLISSFYPIALEAAMDMMPEWPRGMLMGEHDPQWLEMAKYLDTTTININGNKTPPELIEAYLTAGKPLLAYTINDPVKARELFELGVSSVFSDCPDVILEVAEEF